MKHFAAYKRLQELLMALLYLFKVFSVVTQDFFRRPSAVSAGRAVLHGTAFVGECLDKTAEPGIVYAYLKITDKPVELKKPEHIELQRLKKDPEFQEQ
jgi:hypothetical protein